MPDELISCKTAQSRPQRSRTSAGRCGRKGVLLEPLGEMETPAAPAGGLEASCWSLLSTFQGASRFGKRSHVKMQLHTEYIQL